MYIIQQRVCGSGLGSDFTQIAPSGRNLCYAEIEFSRMILKENPAIITDSGARAYLHPMVKQLRKN